LFLESAVAAFYGICAGAAATLVGLLFVAVQVGPPLATEGPVGRRHAMARSTYTIFTIIFVVALFLMLPTIPPVPRAEVVVVAALSGAFRAVRTWLPLWRDKLHGRVEFRLWQTAWLLVGPLACYIYLSAVGLVQIRTGGATVIDRFAGTTFLLLFVIAIRNSWNLLVEATASALARPG